MTEDGEKRANKLQVRLVEYARSNRRYSLMMAEIADGFDVAWFIGDIIELPDRVMCPSCGMRGAVFMKCNKCAGPVCDNCHNKTKANICILCDNGTNRKIKETSIPPIKIETAWIQTYTGKVFEPEFPRPELIDHVDIAHSLALLCRFNGACNEFYSVAQHSIHVAELLPDELKLCGLLHDATEAYIGDMVRPLKMLIPRFAQIEELIMFAISQRFNLVYPIPQKVKYADNVMLATEARDLMAPHPKSWGGMPEPLPIEIVPMSSSEAEIRWTTEFLRLFDGNIIV